MAVLESVHGTVYYVGSVAELVGMYAGISRPFDENDKKILYY